MKVEVIILFTDKMNLYRQYRSLLCPVCGKDLLLNPKNAHVIYVKKKNGPRAVIIYDFYWACKGLCEQSLNNKHDKNAIFSREEIADLIIPFNFINFMLGNLHAIHDSLVIYEQSPFDNMKFFISRIAQLSVREQDIEEINRIDRWL